MNVPEKGRSVIFISGRLGARQKRTNTGLTIQGIARIDVKRPRLIEMEERSKKIAMLNAKDDYNRITLKKSWSDARSALKKLRHGRLRLSFEEGWNRGARITRELLFEGFHFSRSC